MGTEPKTKLTIVYSPHYDSEVYLGDAPEEMGTVYVGPKKPMDLLQLRAGIHVNIKSDVEREAEYLNAVNAYLADDEKKEVAFFEGAAKVDPFGVAGKLLRWRDNLIMAGWNVTCEDSKCAKHWLKLRNISILPELLTAGANLVRNIRRGTSCRVWLIRFNLTVLRWISRS